VHFLKLKKIYNYLKPRRLIWSPEKNKTVLILNDVGLKHIVSVLKNTDYFVFRDSHVIYAKQILLALLSDFSLRGAIIQYYLKVFDVVAPKLIITFVDNQELYWNLDKRVLKKYIFLTVQNGTHYIKNNNNTLYVYDHWYLKKEPFYSNFACFSKFDFDYFTNHGAIIKQYFPIGNVYLSEYISMYKPQKKIFDLCVISHGKNNTTCYKKIFEYVVKYSKSRDIKACVALKRNHFNNDFIEEVSNLYDNFGDSNIFLTIRTGFSSQYLSDSSEVTISRTGTTLLRQTFSRGNKIYPLNFYEQDLSPPFDLLISNMSPTYEEFEIYMDKLISMDISEYLDNNTNLMGYLDTFDIEHPPAKKLESIINKFI